MGLGKTITHCFSTFSHKNCSVADLKLSAVAGELICIDKIREFLQQNHLMSFLSELQILVP